jgi:hypothetical protein
MGAEGKAAFYSKADQSMTTAGFRYFDGDRDIRGKGRSHASKPDYIAARNGELIIGEIKSPLESPKSGSWRTPQKSDTEPFSKIRLEVAGREQAGEVSKEIGGHLIIIRGQIPDYVRKLGVTYDVPAECSQPETIKCGYTVPEHEKGNVIEGLRLSNIDAYEVINDGNGSVTFIYQLPV